MFLKVKLPKLTVFGDHIVRSPDYMTAQGKFNLAKRKPPAREPDQRK